MSFKSPLNPNHVVKNCHTVCPHWLSLGFSVSSNQHPLVLTIVEAGPWPALQHPELRVVGVFPAALKVQANTMDKTNTSGR